MIKKSKSFIEKITPDVTKTFELAIGVQEKIAESIKCDNCEKYSKYGVQWGICLKDEEPQKFDHKCKDFKFYERRTK